MKNDFLIRVFNIKWDTTEDGESVDVSLPNDIIIDHDKFSVRKPRPDEVVRG